MNHDPLSDVLSSVRLRGAVVYYYYYYYYYVSFGDDWAAETPASRQLADALMPGAEHVLAYDLTAKGSGWAATAGEPPVGLNSGDIVMFPRGDSHVLSSAPGLRAQPDNDDWRVTTRNDPKPIAVAYHRGLLRPSAPLPADEASTVVVCGFVGCDLRPSNPLINALPRLLHLGASGGGAWVAPVLDQAVSESRQCRAGSAAVLERVSEMVFVDAARRHLESLPADASGWLAGLRDRHIGKAIGLLHARPAEPWTIDELGRQIGLSRSPLHQRFVELLGQPPMQYLTNWRMQRGASLLREGDTTVARSPRRSATTRRPPSRVRSSAWRERPRRPGGGRNGYRSTAAEMNSADRLPDRLQAGATMTPGARRTIPSLGPTRVPARFCQPTVYRR